MPSSRGVFERNSKLGLPGERKGGKTSGSHYVELNAVRRVWLVEGEFCLSLGARREIRQNDFLLFQGDAGLIAGNAAHVIPTNCVGREIVARLHKDAK